MPHRWDFLNRHNNRELAIPGAPQTLARFCYILSFQQAHGLWPGLERFLAPQAQNGDPAADAESPGAHI